MKDSAARKFRVPYEKNPRVTMNAFLPSKTKQADLADCDINTIMKKYEKTGLLPEMIKSNPQYGEFADMETYQESLNLVQHAREQFEALPSRVREKFANDPARFLEFVADPKNQKEMVELGLATLREEKPNLAKDIAAEFAKLDEQHVKPETKGSPKVPKKNDSE